MANGTNGGNGANGSGASMRESCGTLKDWWYVACLASDLGRRPIGRTILEENLVIFRDESGKPHCLLDRCLHRNAQLSEGFVAGGCLVCPYHGWTYEPDGQCVRIPTEGPDTFVRPHKTLPAFPVREQQGLIWVYMGDPAAIRNDPFEFPRWGEQGWESYYMVTPFENDVTNCVENFMDVPHTVTVHAGWFRSERQTKVAASVERTDDSVLVTYHQEKDKIGFSQMILNPSGEPMKHTDKFYMPNMTRVDYDFGTSRSFIITSQCTPVGPFETMVYTAITYRLGRWVLNKLGRFVLPPYTRKVIQQDVEIMANQGRSLRRYGADFMNAEADLLHQYIESLRDWAAAGEVGPRPTPASGEITFYI